MTRFDMPIYMEDASFVGAGPGRPFFYDDRWTLGSWGPGIARFGNSFIFSSRPVTR